MCSYIFFFFTEGATPEIYTLSLHDALPIWTDRARNSHIEPQMGWGRANSLWPGSSSCPLGESRELDRKSTRLNSSHTVISYAVFCLKKKKKNTEYRPARSTSYIHWTQRTER